MSNLHEDYLKTERPKFQWFAQQIASALAPSPKVLDIGFGQAPNPFLAGDVTGLERAGVPTPANYRTVVNWNLDNLPMPFGDEEFDVVILGDVIEHLNRPFEVLRDAHRVLKKNGLLLVSTPNPHYVHEVLKTWLGIYHPDDPEHYVHFPSANLRQYLESCGFHVENIVYFKCWVPIVKWFILKVGIPPAFAYQYLLQARKAP
jgi:SAM-dependent methyltransferase